MRFLSQMSIATVLLLIGSSVSAVTVPFTEDFAADVAGWRKNGSTPLTFESTGGPDGGSYASTTFNYFGFSSSFGGGPVIFRANDSDDASADAFVGDWLAAGVQLVTLYVRHDAPENLTFFMRVASSFNFPGAVIAGTQAVAPGTWTQLSFAVDPLSPLCTGETVSCAAALQNAGNLQFGSDAPSALTALDQSFRLEIDAVSSFVPEPGTLALVAPGFLCLAAFRRTLGQLARRMRG